MRIFFLDILHFLEGHGSLAGQPCFIISILLMILYFFSRLSVVKFHVVQIHSNVIMENAFHYIGHVILIQTARMVQMN